MTRATPIQPNSANKKMRNRTVLISPVKGFNQGTFASVLRTTISATRNGNARKISVTRITTSSNRPPFRPATDPTRAPIANERNADAKPMRRDTRIP